MSKKPSGAEYKRRRKAEEEKARKLPKITSFLKSQPQEESEREAVESMTVEQNEFLQDITTPSNSITASSLNKDATGLIGLSVSNENSYSANPNLEKLGAYKTDIGLFNLNLPLKEEEKMFIFNSESCRPQGPFPKDPLTKRSFSSDCYFSKTKSGQKYERVWLCYSPLLNGVYCEQCWLFADRQDPHYKDSWCTGKINDWQGLNRKLKDHETSQVHLNASFAYSTIKNKEDVESKLKGNLNEWREIIKRILDVVVTLSTCNVPFRGHRNESYKQVDIRSGNFLNVIDLLSRYDPVLKSHLENDSSKSKYLSPKVQNEMINLASHYVLDGIVNEIQEAPFFSLILDTTQDVSRVDQMSVVIRHVSVEGHKIAISESFLGFIPLTEQNAEKMSDEVFVFLEEKDIDIKKCRGQGYDGAAVMSGNYSGVQTRVKQVAQNAEFVHCACHNLNLVLSDSVSNITEVVIFYDLVNQLYVFFSESLPRWQALKDTPKENCVVNKTLKRLCPTRWSSRYDCLLSVKVNFVSVLNCLTKIILTSSKSAERSEAIGLRKQMSSFPFVLMLVLQSRLLERFNITSKTLQKEDVSLDEAANLIERSLCELKKTRNEFEEIVDEAKQLAASWNIESTFPTKRARKVKTFFDELTEDVQFTDPVTGFKVNVFNRIIDSFICQLNSRFESLKTIVNHFSFLSPKFLSDKTDSEIIDCTRRFCETYEKDVSYALITQIIGFKNIALNEIKSRKMVKVVELAQFLMVEHNTISSSLPDLCTAFVLFLTIPVTSATAERSFSKLKLIKTYLRNSMTNTRLSALAVLSIEHQRSREINLDKLAEDFINVKTRRM